jgi:hypothetical protein
MGETADGDGAALCRGEWSRIDDCDFHSCKFNPSAVWATSGCNFFDCQVTGEDKFLSKTTLTVPLGVADDDSSLIDDLAAKTTAGGLGTVIYTRAAGSDPRERESLLWRLADALGSP